MSGSEDSSGFVYTDESSVSPGNPARDQYHRAMNMTEEKDSNVKLQELHKVLKLENDNKTEFGFNALEEIIKINFNLSEYNEVKIRYEQLLTYINGFVTRNHSENSINSISEYISTTKDLDLLENFYKKTLEALKNIKNDRLWFKFTTLLVKLHFDRKDLSKLRVVIEQLLLRYIKKDDTGNQSEKSINSVMAHVSTSKNLDLLENFYETTLNAFNDAKNNPLWFRINTKLGKFYFDRGNLSKLQVVIEQLESCQLYKKVQNDTTDVSTQIRMIEVNILKILIHMDKNIKQCKDLYDRTNTVLVSFSNKENEDKFTVPFEELVAILHECSGRLEFHNGEKEKARTEFLDAYDYYERCESNRMDICKSFLIEKLDEPLGTFPE